MTGQTFQFRSYPAEQARRLTGSPRWGRRSLLSLLGSSVLLLSGASFSTFEPGGIAVGLIVIGLGLLVFSGVAFAIWLCRVLRGPGRPWGRLLLLGTLAVGGANLLAMQEHEVAWAAALNGLAWTLAIGLLLRLAWPTRGAPPQAEVARWAAGATGDDIVAQALAHLEADHIVIHNLPLVGRGDADHVVIGPAGVVVVETKYLAGRIICQGDGSWLQVKRDEVRQIADPAAQVQRAAGAVEGRLRSHELWNVPVRAALVLAHPRAELDVSRSPVPVVRPFELVPLLQQLARERARLDGDTVGEVANALLHAGAPPRTDRHWTRPARAQALVELACVLPVVLMLAFGLLGVARVTSTLLGLTAVAREAARAGSRAPDAATAFDWAAARGQQVAAEYGMGGVALYIDTSSFDLQEGSGVLVPGEIRVRADTTVDLGDVPLVSWAQVQVPLERVFAEVVDPYRSARPQGGGGP